MHGCLGRRSIEDYSLSVLVHGKNMSYMYLLPTCGWLKIMVDNRTCIVLRGEQVIERSQAVYDVLFSFSSLNKLLLLFTITISKLGHIHTP